MAARSRVRSRETTPSTPLDPPWAPAVSPRYYDDVEDADDGESMARTTQTVVAAEPSRPFIDPRDRDIDRDFDREPRRRKESRGESRIKHTSVDPETCFDILARSGLDENLQFTVYRGTHPEVTMEMFEHCLTGQCFLYRESCRRIVADHIGRGEHTRLVDRDTPQVVSTHLDVSRDYELDKECASGSFGSVLSARPIRKTKLIPNPRAGPFRKVAIKFQHRDPPRGTTFVPDVIEPMELAISQYLTHRNIIKFLDIRIDRSSSVFVMPLASQTLRDILPDLKLDIFYRQAVFYQILQGLKFAHARGIGHLDLKPQNILVSFDTFTQRSVIVNGVSTQIKYPRIIIADFGISSLQPFPTRNYRIVTTVGWRAPELFLCQEYDPEMVDMWSVGVILLQAVLGREWFYDYGYGIQDIFNALTTMFGSLGTHPENMVFYRERPDGCEVSTMAANFAGHLGRTLTRELIQSYHISNPVEFHQHVRHDQNDQPILDEHDLVVNREDGETDLDNIYRREMSLIRGLTVYNTISSELQALATGLSAIIPTRYTARKAADDSYFHELVYVRTTTIHDIPEQTDIARLYQQEETTSAETLEPIPYDNDAYESYANSRFQLTRAGGVRESLPKFVIRKLKQLATSMKWWNERKYSAYPPPPRATVPEFDDTLTPSRKHFSSIGALTNATPSESWWYAMLLFDRIRGVLNITGATEKYINLLFWVIGYLSVNITVWTIDLSFYLKMEAALVDERNQTLHAIAGAYTTTEQQEFVYSLQDMYGDILVRLNGRLLIDTTVYRNVTDEKFKQWMALYIKRSLE